MARTRFFSKLGAQQLEVLKTCSPLAVTCTFGNGEARKSKKEKARIVVGIFCGLDNKQTVD